MNEPNLPRTPLRFVVDDGFVIEIDTTDNPITEPLSERTEKEKSE